jgi:hypothetical protein
MEAGDLELVTFQWTYDVDFCNFHTQILSYITCLICTMRATFPAQNDPYTFESLSNVS